MLKIKCNRNEYNLNEKDLIMFNGACYQIISRTNDNGSTPIVSKILAKKLITAGSLRIRKELQKDIYCTYYSI